MPNGTFTVTITGLPQLTAAFQEYPSISLPILQRALSASSAVLAKNTTRRTVPWRTGFLTQSFRSQVEDLVLTWFPTASYARYVEFGTGIYGPEGKPFTITAKDKKALYWPGAAHPVKSVTIQGQRPNDYMGRIVAASQEEINQTFGTALQQITDAIAAQTNGA